MKKILDGKPHTQIQIKFEKRDIWVGLYWQKSFSGLGQHAMFDFYICIVPLLPIHIRYTRRANSKEYQRLNIN